MNLSDFLDLSERKSCHCEYSDNNDIDWVKMSSSGRFSAFAFVSKCALVFIVVLCSFLSQLLAVFRFLCLQLGYAAFRLRHWWVVAVCQFSPTQTHTHTHALLTWILPHSPPRPQVTTLVTSVFLVVKVILSNVSGPHFPLSPPRFHTQSVNTTLTSGLDGLLSWLFYQSQTFCHYFIVDFLTCNIFNIPQVQDNEDSGTKNLLSQNAFGYVLPITSFVVAWLETWFLDFKVFTQEADDERGESTTSGWSEHETPPHPPF